jgi:CheY-like chemotaxis protein
VLLGSDAGDFAASLAGRLELDGCSVVRAFSRDDLVAMAERPFDAIFLDLDAPEVDALAVLGELKTPRSQLHCPIVLIASGHEPEHVLQRGLDLGAAGFVVKDRMPDDLSMATVFESAGITYRDRPPSPPMRDACPHSAMATFHECAAFMAIHARMERVSCSHLRIGTAETWRLYPRCAIGDATARAKYARDQVS